MIIGICDDEPLCIEVTLKHCKMLAQRRNEKYTYLIFHSGDEVCAYDGTIDILLLDIEMGDCNGIETMREIENSDKIKNIYFISSHESFVFDSFGKKTRGFLKKPIDSERFYMEVGKTIENETNKAIVEITSMGEKVLLPIGEIVYVEAEGNYLRFITSKEEYFVCGKMIDWEEILSNYHFARVHKSYLVNFQYVDKIKVSVSLTDTEVEIPVGRKYRESCREAFREYTITRFRERNGG